MPDAAPHADTHPAAAAPAGATAAPAHRGRWQAIVNAADLPAPLAALVRDTIRRSRLWRSERADLARELVAHFRDGIAAGRSVDQLAADFGDPRAAARLITRAKRRGRPAWARGLATTWRGLGAIFLLCIPTYLYLGARYYLGRPNITHNYAAELNRPILATPVDERAWPLIIEAIKACGQFPQSLEQASWPNGPEDPAWADAVEYLHTHRDALALVRRAAAAPVLGYVYSGRIDPDLSKAYEVRRPGYKAEPEPDVENPMLVGVLLPQLGEFRRFSRMLAADATDAALAVDRERFMAEIDASFGLARLCWSEPMVISQIVGIMIADATLRTASERAFTPGLLNDDDLVKLAHRVGAFGDDSLQFNFSSDRLMYEDFLQRFYTDNGRGDGVPIHAELPQVARDFGFADPSLKPLVRFALPVLTATNASRAEIARQAEATMAAYEHDQNLPMWRRSERVSDAERVRLIAMVSQTLRFMESLTAGSSMERDLLTRDLFEMRRDALLTALALETFHRKTGGYPAALDELVPRYLPRLPIDGADGRTLRCTLVDGRPLLYSLGADGDDDGGRPPLKGNKEARRFFDVGPDTTDPDLLKVIDGDWILYPTPPDQSDR